MKKITLKLKKPTLLQYVLKERDMLKQTRLPPNRLKQARIGFLSLTKHLVGFESPGFF